MTDKCTKIIYSGHRYQDIPCGKPVVSGSEYCKTHGGGLEGKSETWYCLEKGYGKPDRIKSVKFASSTDKFLLWPDGRRVTKTTEYTKYFRTRLEVVEYALREATREWETLGKRHKEAKNRMYVLREMMAEEEIHAEENKQDG